MPRPSRSVFSTASHTRFTASRLPSTVSMIASMLSSRARAVAPTVAQSLGGGDRVEVQGGHGLGRGGFGRPSCGAGLVVRQAALGGGPGGDDGRTVGGVQL